VAAKQLENGEGVMVNKRDGLFLDVLGASDIDGD
jgi:hypothetical protein